MEIKNKVTIIGAGMVGSTTAYSLIAANITEEIALIDLNQKLVKSQVMDLQHSVPLWGYTRVKVGNYTDIKDSKIVAITCGVSQKSGDTRLDLVKKNSAIIKEIVPKIFKQNPKVIVVVVTNPVDVLTHQIVKMFPSKKNQIMGSGTILDSARFRFLLSQKLKVNPLNVHAYIVGEHGDSELPLWSTADVGGTPLDKFKKISTAEKKKIFNQTKNAAYTIIEGKQATYYAIGAVITQLAKAILFDRKTVLPISRLFQGEYGISDICLSLPAVIGRQGIINKINPEISATEKNQLKRSAQKLKKAFQSIK
ncbi:MAG: L-lactate dehydrogenase [Parcubacteria group bacterium]|nr:L-lactate dehydrogenase [Parcubacteria group bacterium]|tara:strand:+ start:1507 stop:2433 length:927 start_codon:yes stop_codon:yes gene_type:complete